MAETVVRNQVTAFITDAHSRGLEKLDLDLLLLMDSEQLCSSISPNFFLSCSRYRIPFALINYEWVPSKMCTGIPVQNIYILGSYKILYVKEVLSIFIYSE